MTSVEFGWNILDYWITDYINYKHSIDVSKWFISTDK